MLIVTGTAFMERRPTLAAAVFVAMIIAMFGPAAGKAHAATLQDEQRCLALTLYWEARGEGRAGMVAVGWTVLNRVRSPQFPGTPCRVVYQGGETPPCQFSWWCDGKSDKPRDRKSWQFAQLVAAELLFDPPPDPTDGALYFHSASIRPPWRGKLARTARIGAHVFYR
jgi:N-acetylmuramoyl-L-alanine amidase